MDQIDSLKTGQKFKKTEVGEIPVDWEVVKIEEILSLNYGDGLPESERENGDYPVYGSNGIIGFHNKYLVKGPGIIIGRKGTIGNITLTSENFWPIDTTYYVNIDKSKILLHWLFYKLIEMKLYRLNAAAGIPGLNRNEVLKLKISIPQISEQKKIVKILITVDDAIEKSNKIIEKIKELKKGLMQELLTRGIEHKKFKKTEVCEIPVNWDINKIGKNTIIPIPSFSEQKESAEILASIDNEIEKVILEKEKLEQIKKGLMQVLLTGKVRFKI